MYWEMTNQKQELLFLVGSKFGHPLHIYLLLMQTMEMEPGKLFIGGISWDTSEERLREYFQTFGEILETVIMRDRNTGRARGFGFIVFANASVADRVVQEKHVIDGRTVEAKKAVPRDDHQNFNRNNGSIHGSPGPAHTKKIFVGGLASTVTETSFKQYFDQFGTITDVVVMYDHNTQRPRGFGFITYDSEEGVERALFKTFHELNGKMVEVKRAVPKELSPGPTTRSHQPVGGGFGSGGYGGLNRTSGFLGAYSLGYGSNPNSPMRVEGRFSPVTVGRRGYPPYSPSSYSSSSMGPNLDLGFGLNYGPGPDLNLGCGRVVDSSYVARNANRFGSGPVGYDAGGALGNGPLANKANQSLWSGDEGLDYGPNSNAFFGSGDGNVGSFGSFGNIGEVWGSSLESSQGGNVISYGNGEDGLGGRGNEYGRKNGGIASTYALMKNIHDENFDNLYGRESFYADHGWRSPSPKLEGSFGRGLGANGDMTPNNSVGYVGGYCVNARTNRGMAA